MKKLFEEPRLDVLILNVQDIITSSSPTQEPDEGEIVSYSVNAIWAE